MGLKKEKTAEGVVMAKAERKAAQTGKSTEWWVTRLWNAYVKKKALKKLARDKKCRKLSGGIF